MSFSYDWVNSPTIAQVRMMVGDTQPSPAPLPIFQDIEIQGALNAYNSQSIIIGLSGYNVSPPAQIYSFGRAAALLLNSINATKARIVVSNALDVHVTASAASAALKALAQSYIDQENSVGYFAVAEMGVDQFWYRERLYNQLLRCQS
jgi:hypothetical protein